MKQIILILAFFSSFNMFSFQELNEFDLYVTAKSGLSIREKPSLLSQKIGRLNYKSKVKIKKVLFEKFESIYDENLKISSNWILIENPSNPKLESYVFGGFLRQKDFKENIVIDTSNWVNFRLEKHNISLKQPKGWVNITMNWDENIRLITHENGIDPTQVIIRVKNKSINQVEKDIINQKWLKKIEEIIINKKKILKCTYYFDNGSSNILYLHKMGGNKTNVVEVSGTSDTHPNEYDKIKITVAESVRFLN